MFAGCRCPRCSDGTLAVAEVEGRKALGCPHCSGAFVGAELGLRLLAVLSPKVPPLRPGGPFVPCPVCRQAMRRVIAAKIEVETCKTHGVWLDAGDLGPLVRAVAVALGKPIPAAVASLKPTPAKVAAVNAGAPVETSSGTTHRPYQSSAVDVAADVAVSAAEMVFRPIDAVADVVLFPFRVVGLLSELVD